MSSNEEELLVAIPADTPDGHGGTGGGTVTSPDIDSTTPQEPLPADPPDGTGGTET